jgi:hypothetical protein
LVGVYKSCSFVANTTTMTKESAMQKMKAMIEEHNKALIKECERLLNCGGVDVTNAEDNFLLPKVILHVALLNEAHQYRPLSKEMEKEVKNLKYF